MEDFKNIFVLGIGLIGGSMARDLKRVLPESTLYGIDSSENHLSEAVGLGVIRSGKFIFTSRFRCNFRAYSCYRCGIYKR